MPDLITHATFANDIFCRIKEDNFIPNIKEKYKEILILGSQGPDIFYFYRAFTMKKKKKDYANIGNKMHDYYTEDFLIESIKYLKSNFNDLLYAYITGLICHRALDSKTHPYVYHVTGVYDRNNKDTYTHRGNHVRLERAIDSILLKEKWGIGEPHKFKIHQEIFNFQLNESIFKSFYNHVFEKVFKKKDGGTVFIESYKAYKKYVKLLYDPYGVKKKIAFIIDKLINKKSKVVLETLFYKNNINEDVDYLNINKTHWNHPVDNSKSNKSFLDLYNEGIDLAIKEISIMNQYLDNNINEEDLQKNITNISYSTGLDWKKGKTFKHYNVIF